MYTGVITKLDAASGVAHLQPDGTDNAIAVAIAQLGAAAKEQARFAFEMTHKPSGDVEINHAKALLPQTYVGRSPSLADRRRPSHTVWL